MGDIERAGRQHMRFNQEHVHEGLYIDIHVLREAIRERKEEAQWDRLWLWQLSASTGRRRTTV